MFRTVVPELPPPHMLSCTPVWERFDARIDTPSHRAVQITGGVLLLTIGAPLGSGLWGEIMPAVRLHRRSEHTAVTITRLVIPVANL